MLDPSFDAEIRALHARGLRGQGLAIGHLDSGVDANHPLLREKVRHFKAFSPSGLEALEAAPSDPSGHGTYTAGLLVGGEVEGQPLGIATEAELCSGAVIEEGNIVARMLLGMDWVAGLGVSVLSLGFGLHPPTPMLRTMIRSLTQRDILVVAPIGNFGAGLAHAPGTYAEVLSVGATDPSGRVASFSGSENHARTKACLKPDLAAPGVDVLSATPNGTTLRQSGTSSAAARVAGLAALLRQAVPSATAEQVKEALHRTAAPPSDAQDHRVRCGSVRPIAALQALESGLSGVGEQELDPALQELPSQQTPTQEIRATRFVDPRLHEKLSYGIDDLPIDVVLAFASMDDQRRFAAGGGGRPRADVGAGFRMTCLNHAPICIARCTAAWVVPLLDSPDLTGLGAADADRSPR